MRKARLGSQGPEISVVGFGAWEAGGDEYGPNPSDDQAVRAVQAGLDAGMSWVDTAEVYGEGRSEELIGRAVAGRQDVVLATKVAPRPEGTGFAAEEVRAACEGSLKRLGVDVIDLYQLHWPAMDGPSTEETWGAMARLVEDGLVRHIGVSNFGREQIEQCLAIRHVDALQPHFSLLHPQNRDLIRWCGEQGIGVVVYGPLAFGLLTGAVDEDTEFPPEDWRSGRDGGSYYRRLFAPGKLERSLAVTDALRPIAKRLGITPAQLALAWAVHQPGVTSAIAGSRNPDHTRDNAAAGNVELDRATLAEIEKIMRLGPDFAES